MKTILLKIGVISILAFLTLGCSNNSPLQHTKVTDSSFIELRGIKKDNPYGYTEMCKNAWRNDDIFNIAFLCDKKMFCKKITKKTNHGTIGYEAEIGSYFEFCKELDNVIK